MTTKLSADHKARVPLCIDWSAEPVPGSGDIIDQHWVVFMETTCDGINCPPYSEGAEITCVVCTK